MTLRPALQRGGEKLLHPKETWARVTLEEATLPALLLGYALWWMLWAVLGAWVVSLLWALVAVIFIMTLALKMFTQQRGPHGVRYGLDDASPGSARLLQLTVHAMTPVWLLAPLMHVPQLGTWAVYAGVGCGLYLANIGLAALTVKPPGRGVIDTVLLGVVAVFVAMMFDGLGWLTLIAAVI